MIMKSQRAPSIRAFFLSILLAFFFASTSHHASAHPIPADITKRQTSTSLSELFEAALTVLDINQQQVSNVVNVFTKQNVAAFINSLDAGTIAGQLQGLDAGAAAGSISVESVQNLQQQLSERNVERLVRAVDLLGPERASRAIARRVGTNFDPQLLASVEVLFDDVEVEDVFAAMPAIDPAKVVEAVRLAQSLGGNQFSNIDAAKVEDFKQQALGILQTL
ncbi:hypothetical protein HK102_004196 [Quaeritorhiza haematococci]|nr:hypothetical protein HK102_004196 [Quaeritorhiza haematococci]